MQADSGANNLSILVILILIAIVFPAVLLLLIGKPLGAMLLVLMGLFLFMFIGPLLWLNQATPFVHWAMLVYNSIGVFLWVVAGFMGAVRAEEADPKALMLEVLVFISLSIYIISQSSSAPKPRKSLMRIGGFLGILLIVVGTVLRLLAK